MTWQERYIMRLASDFEMMGLVFFGLAILLIASALIYKYTFFGDLRHDIQLMWWLFKYWVLRRR